MEDILSCIGTTHTWSRRPEDCGYSTGAVAGRPEPHSQSDYDSLDHAYLFGPMSHQEERLNVKDAEDLVCTFEDTIEGEHSLEMPSISTLAADDEEEKKM